MSKKRRWTIVVIVATLSVVANTLVLRDGSREPMYKEKPLSYWLSGYDRAVSDEPWDRFATSRPNSSMADTAVRNIGTDAIPKLLKMLAARNSDLTERIFALLKYQQFVPIRHAHAGLQNYKAMLAFHILGANASNAVPELVDLFEGPKIGAQQEEEIAGIFCDMGPAARRAVPALAKRLTNVSSASGTPSGMTANAWAAKMTRKNSAVALGRIQTQPEVAVPALIAALTDPSRDVQALAARSLGNYGPVARPALPHLVSLIKPESGS